MVAIANISVQRIFDLRNMHKFLIVSALLPLRFLGRDSCYQPFTAHAAIRCGACRFVLQ